MDNQNLPNHIAIIMDGNRRWAREHNLDIPSGHKQGAQTLEKIVLHAKKIGIKYITVYAFSTENWKRSSDEVNALMMLLKNYLNSYAKRADTDNIKINVLGDMSALSKGLQNSIKQLENRTKDNNGIVFNIALNYGGRDEIVRAVRKIAKEVKDNNLTIDDIDEKIVENNLYTAGIPDPDLLIRTSGEMRISNFLPWQIVYSEFLFVKKYWPDFTESDLEDAITEYQKRNRKFGAK